MDEKVASPDTVSGARIVTAVAPNLIKSTDELFINRPPPEMVKSYPLTLKLPLTVRLTLDTTFVGVMASEVVLVVPSVAVKFTVDPVSGNLIVLDAAPNCTLLPDTVTVPVPSTASS